MTKSNHLSVRAEHVRTNETAHTAENRAGQNNQITEADSTASDSLLARHALGKPAKEQQQVTAKKQQRGRIDPVWLWASLIVLPVYMTLLVLVFGGLGHA